MYEHHIKNYSDVFRGDSLQKFKTLGSLTTQVIAASNEKYQDQAKKIRTYYSNKFMVMSFRNENMTRFRKQLLEYLTFTDNEYTEDHIGMIASLPRMYAEDSIIEDLKDCFNNSPWLDEENNGKPAEIDLTFVDSHTKRAFRHTGRTRDEWMVYWCHDENDRLYMIEMDLDCPFRNYWSSTIEHTFRVQGTPIKHAAKDGLRYYTLVDWQIL